MMDEPTSRDVLKHFTLGDLETTVRDALDPTAWPIALTWVARCCEEVREDLILGLVAHDPALERLARHVLDDQETPARLCAEPTSWADSGKDGA